MTDEPHERRPIAPPETKHPDDRARVPLEAALGVIPGVSGLLKLVGESYRPRRKSRAVTGKARSRRERTNTLTASMNTTRLSIPPRR